MSVRRRRWLRAAAAVAVPAVAASCAALTMPAAAAAQQHHHRAAAVPPPVVGHVYHRKGTRGFDPQITVNISGDRVGSSNTVTGLAGVTFRATGNTVSANTGTCTTNAAGTCTISVTSTATQAYTVAPEGSPPAGWFNNPGLGVYNGTPQPVTNPATAYSTVTTPSLGPGATAVVPVASNTSAVTSRTDRIAFSRTDAPDPTECGLHVGLAIDLSSSVAQAGVIGQYRAAAQSFVTALQGTPSEVAVHTFGTDSPATSGTVGGAYADNSNAALHPVATQQDAQAVRDKIGQLNVVGTQYTNWDAAIDSFNRSGEKYDVVIMLSDGDPTRYGRPTADPLPAGTGVETRFRDVENAIFSSNTLKAAEGAVVEHPAEIAVGIAPGAALGPGSTANLRAISGPDDFYVTDFDQLGQQLRNLARQECEGTVSVVKHIVPHDGGIADATPGGPGWSFTSTVPAETRTTDGTSSVNFATTGETPTTITAHERHGYTFLHADTHCHIPGSDAPVTYEQRPNGLMVTPNPEEPITCDVYNRAPAPRPAISIVKRAWPTQFGVAGEELTYTFDVKNTGQTPLHNIHVQDSLFGHIKCPRNELGVDESMKCEYIHYTTEEDVERGSIHNTVRVTGEDPATEEEVHDDSEFTVDHVTGPHIQLEKVAFPTQYGVVGEVITYTYRVVNTGTATLHDVTLHDSRLGGITCPSAVLEPGHEMDCTGHHTITADDIAAGHIHNVATVSGHDPESGRTVTDTDDATVTHHAGPGIQIEKEASPVRFTGAGQTVHYTYRVANTGNVTLHNLSVHDSKVGLVASCDATTLHPGEETTCRATYTTTQADVERGYIPNFAYARGYKPDGNSITSAPAEAIVTGPQEVPVTG